MRTITSKSLHIQLKRGATVEDLLQRYDFETEEELFQAMRKTFSSDAVEGFIKAMKRNSKLPKSSNKASKSTQETLEDSENHSEVQCHEFDEDSEGHGEVQCSEFGEDAVLSAEPVVSEEQLENSSTTSLQELLRKEEALSEACRALEFEHVQLSARRRGILDQIAQVKNVLSELQRLLRENKNKVQTLMSEYNTLADEMHKKSKEIACTDIELENVRTQIEELKKVYILVFADRVEFEDGNGESITFPLAEDSLILSQLLSAPEAEEFTLREIKTIAKAFSTVKKLKEEGTPVEFVFDNPRATVLRNTLA